MVPQAEIAFLWLDALTSWSKYCVSSCVKLIKYERAKEETSTLVNAQASQDVASSSSSDLARPPANVAPKPKPKPSPRIGRGKPKPRAMGSMVPIDNHFSPLPELPPLPPGFILLPDVFALFSQISQAAEVDVVSRIVISCVVAHAFHAWVLVSPSVTTRSLIRNPVANMRCACKAFQNPPRSLISYRSCISYTRVGW